MRYPEIAAEILAMAEADQAMRRGASTRAARFDPETDRRHAARMREIVRDIGWPTRSKVEEQAEHMAWLLVQHADHDRSFQRECLALMSTEAADEVCPAHLAYLEDRLAVAEGRPQRFGTQLVEGRPAPIDRQSSTGRADGRA